MQNTITDISSKKVSPLTLVYLKDNDKVLLLKRSSRKKMVAREWLGLGGKVEPGEELIASARREFKEESGLNINDPLLRGTFTWVDETIWAGTLYIFIAKEYDGDLLDRSDEGELKWHKIIDIDDLTGLAGHQKLFLKKLLLDDNYFYCGIAVYEKNNLISYADNEQCFSERQNILR
ncbi:MAG: 8-oxo-dGTP diphosphatase [bacterium]|nr:8-oxo-dGTP diphosphatase [bacterium]